MTSKNTKDQIIHIQKSDDITSLTEAIKTAKSNSVRLVTDSGATALKSATNIKLIKKIAEKSNKQVVFVNPPEAIKSIIGDLGMKAAKDANSPAFLVQGEAKKVDKNIILESPKIATPKAAKQTKTAAITEDQPEQDELDEDEEEFDELAEKQSQKGISIPNFERFRKKTLLIWVGLFGLIGLWFLAFKILPTATVQLRLQTEKIAVQESVTISNTFNSTNVLSKQIKAQKAVVERQITKEINTTGTKNIGEKATGTVKVFNENSSTTENFQAGTRFQSTNGLIFIADAAFSVGPATVDDGDVVPGSGTAQVTAEKEGEDYNLSSQANLTILNASGSFTAEINAVSGGTTEEVQVVSQQDIDDFRASLNQPAPDEIDSELQRQFDQDLVVLSDTATVEIKEVVSDPEVGKEAKKTNVRATVVYSIFAVAKQDIEDLVKANINLSPDGGEKLYSVDTNSITAKTTEEIENGLIIDISVQSYIGPEFDEAELAKAVEGQRFSEAIETLTTREGIVDADIQLSPFWVNKLPSPKDVTFVIEVSDNSIESDG